MAEEKATQKESAKINPADNLDGWLNERLDAKGAVESDPAQPTTETVAQAPPQPVIDWREVVLPDDVDHGFFRGKKVPQVIDSYRNAEARLKQKEQESADLRRQLDGLQRQREAEDAARKVQQQQQAPTPSPDAEIERLWFDNPKEAAARVREQAIAESRAITQQEVQKARQEAQAESYQTRVYEAGTRASDAARRTLNLDEATWKLRGKAVYLELTDQRSDYFGDGQNLFRPEEIVKTYKALWGEPAKADATPIVVKQAPEPPNPPGTKKPASQAADSPGASPLSAERQRAIKTIASIGRVDPKLIEKRQADRKQGEKRG